MHRWEPQILRTARGFADSQLLTLAVVEEALKHRRMLLGSHTLGEWFWVGALIRFFAKGWNRIS